MEVEKEQQWTAADHEMMRRALDLASKGVGLVSPGPLVGCVIVTKSGEIAGEGHYETARITHAEVQALDAAGQRARGATAYVTLEPHAHHARTPPCTDALIAAGVRRVVVAIEDPNPKVSGRGIMKLRNAGLDVTVGLLRNPAERQNEKYIHFIRYGRPFVHLKLACSLDGRIATRTGDSRWITGAEARARVHHLRHEYDAILVGANTVAQDDPMLTDRSALPRRRPLVRVVLDGHLRFPHSSKLARTARDAPVLVFTCAQLPDREAAILKDNGVEIIQQNATGSGTKRFPLDDVLRALGERSIQSVLVEGGAQVAGAFLDMGLIDKLSFFIAPIVIGGSEAVSAIAGAGVARIADALRLADTEIVRHGVDLEVTGYPQRPGADQGTGYRVQGTG